MLADISGLGYVVAIGSFFIMIGLGGVAMYSAFELRIDSDIRADNARRRRTKPET